MKNPDVLEKFQNYSLKLDEKLYKVHIKMFLQQKKSFKMQASVIEVKIVFI